MKLFARTLWYGFCAIVGAWVGISIVNAIKVAPIECSLITDGFGRYSCSQGCRPVANYEAGRWTATCEVIV